MEDDIFVRGGFEPEHDQGVRTTTVPRASAVLTETGPFAPPPGLPRAPRGRNVRSPLALEICNGHLVSLTSNVTWSMTIAMTLSETLKRVGPAGSLRGRCRWDGVAVASAGCVLISRAFVAGLLLHAGGAVPFGGAFSPRVRYSRVTSHGTEGRAASHGCTETQGETVKIERRRSCLWRFPGRTMHCRP